jgi:hypothetical protein
LKTYIKILKNIRTAILFTFFIINLNWSLNVYAKNSMSDFEFFNNSLVASPDPVTNPMARLVSSSEALITFNAPVNNGGNAISGYMVTSSPGNISVLNASSPVLITGLNQGVQYTFTIVAINASGTSIAATTAILNMGGYWDLNGNSDINSSNFIGTTDSQALHFKTNNTNRMVIGTDGSIDFKNNTLQGFSANVEDKTTSYKLTLNDNGKLITFNANSNLILNIPTGLPIGFNVNILQKGSGKIDFQAASGVTLNNRGGFYTTIGLYAAASLVSYDTNVFVLSGDLD